MTVRLTPWPTAEGFGPLSVSVVTVLETIDPALTVTPVSVMAPGAVVVIPAPLAMSSVSVPVPRLSVVPDATVITAAPAARSAATTPSAAVSLAVSVRLPLSVVMLALMSTLFPADSVSAPPLPPALATIGLFTVMSLLAWSTTAVPLSSVRVRKPGVTVIVVGGLFPWSRPYVIWFGSSRPMTSPPLTVPPPWGG